MRLRVHLIETWGWPIYELLFTWNDVLVARAYEPIVNHPNTIVIKYQLFASGVLNPNQHSHRKLTQSPYVRENKIILDC